MLPLPMNWTHLSSKGGILTGETPEQAIKLGWVSQGSSHHVLC